MLKNKKILIIGSNSFIGKRLSGYFAIYNNVIGTYHKTQTKKSPNINQINKKLDIVDASEVEVLIKDVMPEIIIITAALSSNNYAEELLLQVNNQGIKNIVAAVKNLDYDPLVIFFSTEQIFDGSKGKYTEQDTPKPINAYGTSKLAGENEVKNLKNNIILRCSVVFGLKIDYTDHDTFVTKSIDATSSLQIFSDVYRAPLFIDDIPIIIEELVEKQFCGTINISCGEEYSYEQMNDAIKNEFNITRQDNIVPCKIEGIPKMLALDIEKLKQTIDYTPTSFQIMIKKMRDSKADEKMYEKIEKGDLI